MPFSRPFRALLTLSGLWAVPWTVLGVAVGLIRWVSSAELASLTSLSSWLAGHALAYGALGWISGLYLGLLFARVERGNDVSEVTPRRVALLAALGMLFGAPPAALLSLLGLVAISAGGSVLLATSSQAAATRAALTGSPQPPPLPTN